MQRKSQFKNAFKASREISAVSELQRLSRDPDITKCPDPKIRIGFHAPDELGDEELVILRNRSGAQARRIAMWQPDWRLRRSPKE